jgi:hypothetical protein
MQTYMFPDILWVCYVGHEVLKKVKMGQKYLHHELVVREPAGKSSLCLTPEQMGLVKK